MSKRNKKTILRGVAVILGAVGFTILAVVLYPIAEYEWTSRIKYPALLNPVVDSGITLKYDESSVDYTKASTWFPIGSRDDFEPSRVSHFTLSIPTLNIEDASVAIGGEDLSKSLIQYPGTALPGRTGNSVIFGHSILPIYYDPTNYLAIFSTLPTMEEGDDVYVDYDGVSYHYEVESMFEVLPTDLHILDQSQGDQYLSLITCTPPGHPQKPKRLVVRAKIRPYGKNANNTRY